MLVLLVALILVLHIAELSAALDCSVCADQAYQMVTHAGMCLFLLARCMSELQECSCHSLRLIAGDGW